MTFYLDASALLKLYLDEPDSAACQQLLRSEPEWATARHTAVEVRRNLVRELEGVRLAAAREEFALDWAAMTVIELSRAVCGDAAEIAEVSGVRTLDALHVAAAKQAGGGHLPFVTYDLRQAQAARALGWTVLGI